MYMDEPGFQSTCPQCGGVAVTRCQCPCAISICSEGHTWYASAWGRKYRVHGSAEKAEKSIEVPDAPKS
jgi:hypothetical protein